MSEQINESKLTGWTWVPTLYFAEALPYVIVNIVSVVMYKNLGLSNSDIALYTSWLYIPWIIKPFWSPLVDLFKSKRSWVIITQLFIGAGLASVALTIPTENFFQYTLAFFWIIAFGSATHDIAADGFYMIGLSENKQAFFVGIRNTFYRIGNWFCQGVLVMLVGILEESSNMKLAWSVAIGVTAIMFVLFFIYHSKALPEEKILLSDEKKNHKKTFLKTFASFFNKKGIIVILLFLLIYRLAEAQLVKIASPFFLDLREVGGLGLNNIELGFINGTVGLIALTLGGILGGFAASRNGLKYWLWWMIIAINMPDAVYIYLSFIQPESLEIIAACVAVEQFGYGFGFTAYVLFMIYISQGDYKTSHYAISTGFMALGMMIPGMFSGMLQEMMGYQLFFIWVMVATIPGFVIAKYVYIDPEFGKKSDEKK